MEVIRHRVETGTGRPLSRGVEVVSDHGLKSFWRLGKWRRQLLPAQTQPHFHRFPAGKLELKIRRDLCWSSRGAKIIGGPAQHGHF
jgi:hypothetical protein